MEIIPAIIPEDFAELQQKIKLVEPFVGAVQIDVMDGIFVPNRTWTDSGDLSGLETALFLEAHLMVAKPQQVFEEWLESKVSRIILHWEAMENIHAHELTPFTTQTQMGEAFPVVNFSDEARKHGKQLGIAFNPATPIDILDNFINEIDLVLLMSVNPGFAGQEFQENVLVKIKFLRQKHPNVKIEVDGGINLQNAKKIIDAGADILVVNSAIFKDKNIAEAVEKFRIL